MATLTELNTPKTSKLSHSSKKIQSNSVLKVRVVVRIRPFLPCEINLQEGKDRNPIPCITVLNPQGGRDEEVTVHIKDQETSRNECYKLDSFFGQEDNNVGQIFRSEVSPLIPGIFHGCNATVFAYGATGSGKTYTMQGTDEQPGLMPLAMLTILSMCENTRSSIEISYYEVYMDRCYDLLEPKVKEISVFDDKDGRVQLKGLSQVPIQSMTEFHEVFLSGNQRRKVAHTGLNDVSSRSHGVLMIVVSTRGDGSDCSVTGKLNLIDLAGNEDNRRSGNEGIRLQESAKINQSLFALSNVIYALNNDEPRVPYRESKLTRILQDSLGGTSRALMIACLNPVSYQEAVHTVSLAARSRQIVNYVPSVHKQETTREKVDMEAKLRAWLESKGKMKSIHRTVPPNSPFLGKTPTPVTSQKKSVSVCSSLKSQNIDQGVSNAKGRRKLFDSGTSITVTMEESCSSNALTTANDFVSTKDESLLEVENSKNYANEIHDNLSFLPEDESCTDNKLKPSNAMCIHTADQDKEKMDLAYDVNMSGPSASIADESFDKEKITAPFTNFVGSPTIEEKIRELQNSLRNFFSPINSNLNMTPSEDLSSKERVCLVLFEPKKSKTPHVFTYDNDDLERTGTPLDKFNARSSTLKNSLAQEYLAFLNNASKEELLGLKGIGQKRADYILQLREETPEPLKSLSDLEKIGISSKQVHDMFRTMARGIFS